MPSAAVSRALRSTCRARLATLRRFQSPLFARQDAVRLFHASAPWRVVKPFLLADVGEGITEVQIVQWYVQPGARVAQFDKICDVVSDKASVEITSRFDGVITKLHYEADDIAKVGKPLVDIDIEGEISPELEALTDTPGDSKQPDRTTAGDVSRTSDSQVSPIRTSEAPQNMKTTSGAQSSSSGNHATLATPAVRHLTKEFNLNIEDIPGTGKDGRVLKEDVQKYASGKSDSGLSSAPLTPVTPLGEDQIVPLTPVQNQMFKTMTRSLQIPHFLYSDAVDFTSLNRIRRALNKHHAVDQFSDLPKLSALPFILKAVSLSFTNFPSLNAHLDVESEPLKPRLTHKAAHNIGIAIDTPQGLIVAVVKNVQSHSVASLAIEIQRLGSLARQNTLSTSDLSGATFTISNIGSIGGHVVAPVVVSPQVAILGVGKAKAVPSFDEDGQVVKKEEAVFSWSADHRVVDGATVARCAEMVRGYLEGVERMMVKLR